MKTTIRKTAHWLWMEAGAIALGTLAALIIVVAGK